MYCSPPCLLLRDCAAKPSLFLASVFPSCEMGMILLTYLYRASCIKTMHKKAFAHTGSITQMLTVFLLFLPEQALPTGDRRKVPGSAPFKRTSTTDSRLRECELPLKTCRRTELRDWTEASIANRTQRDQTGKMTIEWQGLGSPPRESTFLVMDIGIELQETFSYYGRR